MTKRLGPVLVLLALFFGTSGCVGGAAGPLPGLIYSDIQGPLGATARTSSEKSGRATASSIAGLVATGDASISAAMQAGGITVIHHVDYEIKHYVVYTTYTTIVYGQ